MRKCKHWLNETRDGLGVYVVCELGENHTTPHRAQYLPLGILDHKEITWLTNYDKESS